MRPCIVLGVAVVLAATAAFGGETNALGVRVEAAQGGKLFAAHMDGTPPAILPLPDPAAPGFSRAVKILANVPAYTWCYGCANTAAAIITGYYDRTGYADLYTAAINGGVAPMVNETAWPDSLPNPTSGECPFAASHFGIAGRTTKGHVDDFWVGSGSWDDPYRVTSAGRAWSLHSPLDCTGDYMWTSWGLKGCKDGDTIFYISPLGLKTVDFDDEEPDQRDGAHGFRLWINSRGYTVTNCFNQLIYPAPTGYSNTMGFTYENYVAEIDAGRPVLLLCGTHTFVGYGYDTTGKQCYIRTTWDNDTGDTKKILWNGSYGGQRMWAVSVMVLAGLPAKPDMLVKAPYDDNYSGNNSYNATGEGQSTSRPCKPAQKAIYLLQAQNDNTVADSFRVTGGGGNSDWTVAYYDTAAGGVNRTAAVTGSGWDIGSVNAGSSKVFRVEVTPSAGLADGASHTITVTLRSLSAPSQLDVVAITTKKYNSGVDPDITPRLPRIQAYRAETDATKADVTITRSQDDPFGCTYYLLWQQRVDKGSRGSWVQIAKISPTTGAATYVYQATGLAADGVYRFGTRAYNGAAKFTNLVACNLIDPSVTPCSPTYFSATRVTGDPSTADLLVGKSPDDPAGCRDYEIQRRATTPTCGPWVTVATLDATGVNWYSFKEPGLDIETGYQYQVRARNSAKTSGWVLATLRNPTVTPRPAELTAARTAAGSTMAKLIITKTLDDPVSCTHYVLQRRCLTPTPGAWSQVGSNIAATGQASYLVYDSGLPLANNYQYQVVAYNGGRASTPTVAYLRDPGITPRAPTITAARIAGTPGVATVTITKSPDDPVGCSSYVVERKCVTGANVWDGLTDFSASGAPSYTATDDSISALDTYQYRVQAFNGTKTSPYATCDLTSPDQTVRPPAYLTATVVAGSGGKDIEIEFGKSPDDPSACTGYEIYARFMSPMQDWVGPIATAGSGGEVYTGVIPGLSAYTSYRFGVRAMNGAKFSALVIADVYTSPTSAKVLTARAVALATPSGGAQVIVTLARDASLSAEVLNITGVVVGRLCSDKPCAAGANVLLWNGRGSLGTRLPGGRYLVRVTARHEDGQQAQVIVPLVMRR